jgi:hypothetical protein
MRFRLLALLTCTCAILTASCRQTPGEAEIRHDVKYLAAFTSPALLTADDERRFSDAFQSRYRNRIVFLRSATGQSQLPQAAAKASLFAVIRVSPLREARLIAREIEQALGGAGLIFLLPLVEMPGSQDNFSGVSFYLSLEKRSAGFLKLSSASRLDLMRNEAEEFSRDRNLLSYFSGAILGDTPYQTVHILGFSGTAESQYQTQDGILYRTLRKLETADTALAEKIR